MNLGMSMLSSLGGGHVDDLARAVLDADETVLPQSRALHGVGGGGTGIGALEGVLMLHIEVSIVSGGRIVGIVKRAQTTAASRKGGVRPHASAVKNVPARRRPW